MNYQTQTTAGAYPLLGSIGIKGWLFQQSWLTRNPHTQLHPLRWTNNCKGACCAQEYRRGGVTNDIAV